jgi:hypothetical protein
MSYLIMLFEQAPAIPMMSNHALGGRLWTPAPFVVCHDVLALSQAPPSLTQAHRKVRIGIQKIERLVEPSYALESLSPHGHST